MPAPIPLKTAAFRDDYRAEVLPARYSGRAHVALVLAAAGGGIVGAIAFALAHGARWPDAWIVPTTLVVANAVEYLAHRGPMHHRTAVLAALHTRHSGRHHRLEGILAGWVSFGRYLLGEHVAVRGLDFGHARSDAISAYEQQLECPVRFGADEASVSVDAELLDARQRFADARFNAALGAWLDRCTVAMAAPDSLHTTRRVAGLLASLGAPGEIDEGGVAATLGLERRTLQRRLAGEGANFRTLLDAARAQHAIVTLLQDTPRLAQLGADIGFQEQSSLCRAFRRWTGYAPLPLKARLGPVFLDLRPEP